jgi:hypothetical protein
VFRKKFDFTTYNFNNRNSTAKYKNTTKSKCGGETPVIMLISTALFLDSNIRNSVCTPSKLPCRRVVEGNKIIIVDAILAFNLDSNDKTTK